MENSSDRQKFETIDDVYIENLSLPAGKARATKKLGYPNELWLWINRGGTKTFIFRDKRGKTVPIGKFEVDYIPIYRANGEQKGQNRVVKFGIADAQKIAYQWINEGIDINELKERKIKEKTEQKTKPRLFCNLWQEYLKTKTRCATYKKFIQRYDKYFASIAKKDISKITQDDLRAIFKTCYREDEQKYSGIHTLQMLFRDLNAIYALAVTEEYIKPKDNFIPALRKQYPSIDEHNTKTDRQDAHHKTFDISENYEILKEFLHDLREAWHNPRKIQGTRAAYLHILTCNRPANTAKARWADIDLQKGVWKIPARDMKDKKRAHTIYLSNFAQQILRDQWIRSQNYEYVFPVRQQKRKDGTMSEPHMKPESILAAIQNTGARHKYFDMMSAHGCRHLFKNICSQNAVELAKLGIGDNESEIALAHHGKSKIERTYTTHPVNADKMAILWQWYADFLNNLENLGINLDDDLKRGKNG